MSEIKQYRCDAPGCTNVTESPLMVKISYARTDAELKELIEMAKRNAPEGYPVPSIDRARAESVIEKGFDLCKDHYEQIKKTFFAEPQKAETPAVAPTA